MKAFTRCMKAFDYKYRQRLQSKTSSLPLTRGNWIHAMLDEYYQTGDWTKTEKKLRQTYPPVGDDEIGSEFSELPDLCDGIMNHYAEYYGEEDLEDIQTEITLTAPGTEDFWFIKGKLDMVFTQDKIRRGRDHKTGRITDGSVRLMDTQLYIYDVLGEANDLGIKIWDYNYIVPRIPTDPEPLIRGGLSKRKNIRATYTSYLRAVLAAEEDPNEYADILRFLQTKPNQFFLREEVHRAKVVSTDILLGISSLVHEVKRRDKADEFPRTGMYRPQDTCKSCEFLHLCITDLHGGDRDQVIQDHFDIRANQYEGGDEDGESTEDTVDFSDV